MEDRLQCQGSGKVRYTGRTDTHLRLAIPLAAATNASEVAQYQVCVGVGVGLCAFARVCVCVWMGA